MGDRAALTVKGPVVGVSRPEFEYGIPLEDARSLLEMCPRPLVEKTRRRIEYRGLTWEVDEFHGENQGLVIAECELTSEDQSIDKPAWVGAEVSGDPRYYNSNLGANPFANW
jgi:adenylate cyclase